MDFDPDGKDPLTRIGELVEWTLMLAAVIAVVVLVVAVASRIRAEQITTGINGHRLPLPGEIFHQS
jgi:hypothetical protein